MSIIRPIQYPADRLDRFIHDGIIPAPLLDWNFARKRNLVNHQGVGDIAYSRGSAGTEFDHNLNLRELANNIAPFTHDPVTGVSYGLQVPRSTVNEARNNRAAGATNGVIGSGGVVPTDWGITGAVGLAVEIVGTGTEDGIPYCDVRFNGTRTSGDCRIIQVTTTTAAALQNEVWTHSHYSRLVGGDLTNVTTVQLQMEERDGAGAFLGGVGSTVFTPTTAALKTQRRVQTATLGNANTAFIYQFLHFIVASGVIDFTLRLAGTQLEEVPFVTPLVLTDPGGSSTRAAPLPTIDLASIPGYDPARGTALLEYTIPFMPDDSGIKRIFIMDEGSNDNKVIFYHNSSSASPREKFLLEANGVNVFNSGNDPGAFNEGARHKVIIAWESGSSQCYTAYQSVSPSEAFSFSINPTTIRLMHDVGGLNYADGSMGRFTLWQDRLPNQMMQMLRAA